MYSLFKSTIGSPIAVLGIIVCALLVVFTINAGIDSITSLFGINEKENAIAREAASKQEVDKLVDVVKNNEATEKVNEAINIVKEEKAKETAIISNTIEAEEKRVLDVINNTANDEPIVDTDKTEEKVVTIKEKPTIVYVKNKISNKQKIALQLLKDRADKMKGSVL